MGDREYFETRELTGELINRLEAFLAGGETSGSLEKWARGVWGKTQDGPVHSNRVATSVLMNIWNAAARTRPRDDTSPFILRTVDAAEYLRLLRQGTLAGAGRKVGGLTAPLQTFVTQLALETERHVVDGLGWIELLRFASPGSGRAFALSRPLEHLELQERLSTDVVVESGGSADDVLRDLLETLCLDLDDVFWLAEGFDRLSLRKRTLWRQDDNGQRIAVATFTGLRKAEAALQRYESLPHKQMYWLEDGGEAPVT